MIRPPGNEGAFGAILVQVAIDDDGMDVLGVLEEGNFLQRVAVDEDDVGVVAREDLAQDVRVAHDLAAEGGGGEDALHGRVAEHVDEMGQVARVGAVRGPGEAVVAAGQDADAAPVHLPHGLGRRLDLALQALLDGHVGRQAVRDGFARAAGVGEVDRGGDVDPVLDGLEHVYGFRVGETGMVDDVDARPGAQLDGIVTPRVGADAFPAHVSFVDCRFGLFQREVGLFASHRLVDLIARHAEFDVIDAQGAEIAHSLAHFVHAVCIACYGWDNGTAGR